MVRRESGSLAQLLAIFKISAVLENKSVQYLHTTCCYLCPRNVYVNRKKSRQTKKDTKNVGNEQKLKKNEDKQKLQLLCNKQHLNDMLQKQIKTDGHQSWYNGYLERDIEECMKAADSWTIESEIWKKHWVTDNPG